MNKITIINDITGLFIHYSLIREDVFRQDAYCIKLGESDLESLVSYLASSVLPKSTRPIIIEDSEGIKYVGLTAIHINPEGMDKELVLDDKLNKLKYDIDTSEEGTIRFCESFISNLYKAPKIKSDLSEELKSCLAYYESLLSDTFNIHYCEATQKNYSILDTKGTIGWGTLKDQMHAIQTRLGWDEDIMFIDEIFGRNNKYYQHHYVWQSIPNQRPMKGATIVGNLCWP